MKIGKVCPQAHYLIVGDGPLRDGLMKKTHGVTNIHFLGHREDIADCLAAVDLLIIPSINDGFNLAAVEAMASSKPIVATAVGGLPEVVGDAGILVSSGDTSRMAQEAVKLINSPSLRKELGTKGRRRSELLFDWGVCLQRTIAIYRQVAGTAG
jgi:glycosyltransferase involved in cell wall biosynthesis